VILTVQILLGLTGVDCFGRCHPSRSQKRNPASLQGRRHGGSRFQRGWQVGPGRRIRDGVLSSGGQWRWNISEPSSNRDRPELCWLRWAICGGQTTTTTGLWIGPGAKNSGPYSNIYFLASANCGTGNACLHGTNCACQPTACVKIQAPTRGLHSITCVANSLPPGQSPPLPDAAIYLEG
jgi:hypothetical protein